MIRPLKLLSILAICASTTFAADVLQNSGFTSCSGQSDITVQKLNIKYDKNSNQVLYDVAGTSTKSQEVIVTLTVTAYGREVYKKSFDPCEEKVAQLCPLPTGQFAASGSQSIPDQYAKMIPAIAFTVPDLDGLAKMEFTAKDGGELIGCIESQVANGQTLSTKAVPLIAAGIAGAALVVSGVSALAGGGPGAAGPSPSFGDVIGWFQSIALNGLLTVDYPPIYRSFSRNFAFSGLLIPIDSVQASIDSFRAKTGGNLTEDNVGFLRKQAMFVYGQASSNGTISKRDTGSLGLFPRDDVKTPHYVRGIQAYVEPLIIPNSNTFLTALLILAIVIAAIIVGLLLFKLILEAFSLCGKLSTGLNGFRKRYWWTIAKTITNLILLLYGVWTLYCVYQFTRGDSWAAKALAAVTLALFTAVLAYFIWRIWSHVRNGNTADLYENKETWVKYSIFYEFYKKQYWWVFIPSIAYLFARGVIIAAGDGHGMIQVGAQIGIELLMLLLLVILRPYSHKSGNWIAITISVVRLLSISCILLFVEQLAIAETPKAVTGVVLVVIQAVLTGLLALLIIINGILHCFRANPHRKARKEAEKQRIRDRRLLDASHESYDLEATKKSARSSEYDVSEQPPQSAPLLPPVSHSDHFRDGSQYGHGGYHTSRGYHRVDGQ